MKLKRLNLVISKICKMEYPFSLEKNYSKIKLAEFLKHQANVEWRGYSLARYSFFSTRSCIKIS